MRHQSHYSYCAKIGLVTPATNTVNEAEWMRMMPDGVTFHTQRMVLSASTHAGPAVLNQIDAASEILLQADVDVVAYACTAGSMVTPAHGLAQAASRRIGRPVVTTAAAIVAALQTLGASKISVATPYHQALNDHEVRFLAGHGINTLAIEGLGIGANGPADYPQIARTPIDRVRDLARLVYRRDAQALLLTCTDFPTLTLIDALEAELGIPVVTSNTATLWAALGAAGIGDPIAGGGLLMIRQDRVATQE